MKIFKRASMFLFLMCTTSLAVAQQPGSVEYNTVLLPALGAGDTKSASSSDRWGALASGDGRIFGFIYGTTTKKAAERAAVEDCVANGGKDCHVVSSFVNSCMAIAASPSDAGYAQGDAVKRSIEWVRAEALDACGESDCKIVREGCAFEGRR